MNAYIHVLALIKSSAVGAGRDHILVGDIESAIMKLEAEAEEADALMHGLDDPNA
jgi:hypothetical protein